MHKYLRRTLQVGIGVAALAVISGYLTSRRYSGNSSWYIPDSYASATPEQRKRHSNGCGPAKGIIPIPDAFWGVDFGKACKIHDWMYYKGVNYDDKIFADKAFLHNINITIDEHEDPLTEFLDVSPWIVPMRRRNGFRYYAAVALIGDNPFWNSGSNKVRNIIKEAKYGKPPIPFTNPVDYFKYGVAGIRPKIDLSR